MKLATRAGVPPWTKLELQQAQDMRHQGKTMAEVAAALNRSVSSVTGKLWRARSNDPYRSDKKHHGGDSVN